MLEIVGQFSLQYCDQAQGVLGSLVATPSLLSRVIESQGQDSKILSIRDRVQAGIGDEGWAIHTDGSLQFRGRIVVPQLAELRERSLGSSIALVLQCIQVVRRCITIYVTNITRVG